ncbi:MAG TPA: alpha/beta hydrolase, partial [Trinickia sp.]|nr:alpha/beta hydrolase [Trinickia sp.]
MSTAHKNPASMPAAERSAKDRSALVEMLYNPPLWLPTGHAQTIVPALFGRRPVVDYWRERWNTPDGDFIEL